MLRLTRIAYHVLKAKIRPRVNSATALTEVHLRVWPVVDVDLQYANQSTYFLFSEYSRWDFLYRTPLSLLMKKRKCVPVVASQSVRILTPLKVWDRCIVTSQIRFWDQKWVFIEQKVIKDSQAVALILVKGLFRTKTEVIPATEILDSFNEGKEGVVMPEYFKDWHDFEGQMFRNFLSTEHESTS